MRAAMAVTQTAPSSAMAVARCASTIMGGSSRRTVIAPSTTWRINKPNATGAASTTPRRLGLEALRTRPDATPSILEHAARVPLLLEHVRGEHPQGPDHPTEGRA